MIVSCILTMARISADEKNTEKPREILETEAMAIGSVLNGLKANPIAGKNTGADWNSTVIAVSMPPIQIFFNLNTPYFKLVSNYGTISKTVPWLKSVTLEEP